MRDLIARVGRSPGSTPGWRPRSRSWARSRCCSQPGDGSRLVSALALPLVTGRHIASANALAVAGAAILAIVATRIAFDPSVHRLADAVLTLLYVPLPLLVGRWVRGQATLRAELERKIARAARDRRRDARQAAEDERVRIASDLQQAFAGARLPIGRP